MGQNCIFSLLGYPATGRPKMVVVARKPIFNEKIGFCPQKYNKTGQNINSHKIMEKYDLK